MKKKTPAVSENDRERLLLKRRLHELEKRLAALIELNTQGQHT